MFCVCTLVHAQNFHYDVDPRIGSEGLGRTFPGPSMPFGMVKPGPDCTVSGAKDLFNQIRKYAGAPEIAGEPTLQEIYDERGREFFDENWRRNDMIRFGHFEDEFFPHYKNFPDANFDKRHRIFPVEQEMLDLNPGWVQNPGY